MPLELTRRSPAELTAEVYISPGKAERLERRSIFPPRCFLTVPPPARDAGEEQVTGAYLNALRTAGRRGRLICMELLGVTEAQRDIKCAVRAASIYLREREASITLCVPRREDTREFERGELSQYIAQRYTGAAVTQSITNVFDRPLYRSPSPQTTLSTPNLYNQQAAPRSTQPAAAPRARPTRPGASRTFAASPTPEPSLEELLKGADLGFSETLIRLIDRTGKKDSEIYKKANVDRKLFSKIRSNPSYRPSKTTALAFAVALELDLEGTRDLLSRAGYALNPASRGDIIVEYFIARGNYNIFDINERLFFYDEPILGGAS